MYWGVRDYRLLYFVPCYYFIFFLAKLAVFLFFFTPPSPSPLFFLCIFYSLIFYICAYVHFTFFPPYLSRFISCDFWGRSGRVELTLVFFFFSFFLFSFTLHLCHYHFFWTPICLGYCCVGSVFAWSMRAICLQRMVGRNAMQWNIYAMGKGGEMGGARNGNGR